MYIYVGLTKIVMNHPAIVLCIHCASLSLVLLLLLSGDGVGYPAIPTLLQVKAALLPTYAMPVWKKRRRGWRV
jgi:hypothetical protein